MMNNESVIDYSDYFFIIDSDNLNSVESKLYGYALLDEIIVTNEYLSLLKSVPKEGAFVLVRKNDNKITINQDYLGCFGVYLYRKDDRFVISNSFLILMDYLKSKVEITFNSEYADYLSVSDVCPYTAEDTLIKEIKMLDRSAQIIINIETKEIDIEMNILAQEDIDIDSDEAMDVLDKWYKKWTEKIKRIIDGSFDITVDLSGGFDSRVIIALFIASGADLSKINVNSANDNLHVHSEDYKIASQIADKYNFKLNNLATINKKIALPINDVIRISQYIKFGFHKQLYPVFFQNQDYKYRFTGEGAEVIRAYGYDVSTEDLYNMNKKYLEKHGVKDDAELVNAVWTVIDKNIKYVQNKYIDKIRTDFDVFHFLYIETRLRHHVGKSIIERFLSNTITINPTFDPALWRIKSAPRILPAVIFDRYCEGLLYFEIEGNRSFTPAEIQLAKEINARHGFKNHNMKSKDVVRTVPKNQNFATDINSQITKEKLNQFYKNAFSKNIQHMINT